jgi:uncharacterized membrane protein (UPF0127 family)
MARPLRRVFGLALVGLLFACNGASATTSDPRTSVIASAPGALDGLKASSVKLFDGSGAYREVRFTVTKKAKKKAFFEGCAMLAVAAAEHAQGMMQRTNFAGYDAMIFHFADTTDGAFWMKTVPMDLSVAWVDGTGGVVATAAMKREGNCTNCPIYAPGASYRTAVEAPAGGLARLGLATVGDGSVLAYGGPCRARKR